MWCRDTGLDAPAQVDSGGRRVFSVLSRGRLVLAGFIAEEQRYKILFTKSAWLSSRFLAGYCCECKNQTESKLRPSSLIILGFAF